MPCHRYSRNIGICILLSPSLSSKWAKSHLLVASISIQIKLLLLLECGIHGKVGNLHLSSKQIQLCSSNFNVLPRLKQPTKPQTVKIQGMYLFIYTMAPSKYDLRQLSEHTNNAYSQAPSYCLVLPEISLPCLLLEKSCFLAGGLFICGIFWN